jgi:hypothetical protein
MSLSGLEGATGGGPAALQRSALRARAAVHCAGLAAVLALSAVLEFVKLEQNGYANTFYSAAVKSMLRSWHNFFFVASDPNGFITVDKPPLALWLQALSAKLFGFSPLSLIVPEGICAVLSVALLYRLMAPRFGHLAALASAFALAVFPSFVAVSRDNAVDPLLILLMLAACGAALAAIDGGRLRWLVASAVLVGLAFNTKSLAALLCVPGIGVARVAAAADRATGPRRRHGGRRGGVLVARGRPHACLAATLRRRQRHQLGVPARVRLQRLRPRRRSGGRAGHFDHGPLQRSAAAAADPSRAHAGAAARRGGATAPVSAGPAGTRARLELRPPRDPAIRRRPQPASGLQPEPRRPGGLARAAGAARDLRDRAGDLRSS